jgi:hypothetical protein
LSEDSTAPPSQANGLRWLFIAVHVVETGSGVLMIMLHPRWAGGLYLFGSLIVILIGSNVVVAVIKWFLATPNNRWRGP